MVSDTIKLKVPDTIAPRSTQLVPKRKAKAVKVTTKVKVKASEALRGSSVTKRAVFLKARGGSKKVRAKVSYIAAKKLIVLTPNADLKKGTTYKRHRARGASRTRPATDGTRSPPSRAPRR